MARPALSVCMIVRDEERMLPACLESIAGVFAQLVVVDTGSTDNTVGIAESFGAEVHHFEWVDDFAAARNESIRYATEPWILWLDADERLPESAQATLLELLVPPKKPTIYQVLIRNLQADGKSFTLSMSHRLITRHAELQFSGRIHEQVFPSLGAAGGVEKPSRLVLEHQGYALDGASLRAKLERNRPLLEALVAEQPASGYAHYTLGQNHALLGNHEAALLAYQQALEIKDFAGPSLATLLNAVAEANWQLGRLDEAERHAQRSLALAPHQSSGNFIMYRVMRSRGNVGGQIQWLEALLPRTDKEEGTAGSDLPKDVLIPRQHVLYSLGELHLSQENPAAAEKALQECLSFEPECQETRSLLATAEARVYRWDPLLATLEGVAHPHPEELRELRGIALIKLRRFDEAIAHYRTWLEAEPEHPGLRKRLAGLYAKGG
ncbi:MAG: glycosyltransferase, partial [Candidatus Neomarinimicrobiota bacterium]